MNGFGAPQSTSMGGAFFKDKKANGEPFGLKWGGNRKGRSRENADSSVQSRRPSVWLAASRRAAGVSCQLWASKATFPKS